MSRYEKILVLLALGLAFLGIAAITPIITATVQTFLAQIVAH